VASSASLSSAIAARYASSLFEVALEEGKQDAVEKDLADFDLMIRESADLTRLVRSPVFGAAEQLKALDAVLATAKIGGLAANLLRVMARNRRLFAAGAVLGEYRKLLAAHRGEATAEVTVARELTPELAKELKTTLDGVAGKGVTVHTTVDPSILGGMVVRIGSRQIDTSIRTKLSSLKLALKEVG